MGARQLVGINVWTHLPFWWPRKGMDDDRDQPDVTMIEPPRRLGPLRASATGTVDQVAGWIDLGRRTAGAIFERQ